MASYGSVDSGQLASEDKNGRCDFLIMHEMPQSANCMHAACPELECLPILVHRKATFHYFDRFFRLLATGSYLDAG